MVAYDIWDVEARFKSDIFYHTYLPEYPSGHKGVALKAIVVKAPWVRILPLAPLEVYYLRERP